MYLKSTYLYSAQNHHLMANHLNDDIKIKFLNKKIIRDYKMNNKPATCESGNPTIALQYLPCIGGLTFLFMTSLHNL
jgi:hypothetical protein